MLFGKLKVKDQFNGKILLGQKMNLNQDTIYDALTDIKFKQAVAECKKCLLHKTRHQVVFGAGCSKATLMIIGEAREKKRICKVNLL